MANFSSPGALFALFFWLLAFVAFILVLFPSARTAGLIILAIDVMLISLLTWLSVAGVIQTGASG